MPSGVITTDGSEQNILDEEPQDATGEIEGTVDLSEMTDTDTIVVRIYKATDGTNYRVIEEEEFTGEQNSEPVVIFGPLSGDPEHAPIRLTVEEESANGRNIPWEFQRIY